MTKLEKAKMEVSVRRNVLEILGRLIDNLEQERKWYMSEDEEGKLVVNDDPYNQHYVSAYDTILSCLEKLI